MTLAVGNVVEVEFWGEKIVKSVNAILISGKAGSGKTLLGSLIAKHLLKEKFRSVVIPFATYLKRIAEKSFYWDGIKDEKGRELLQNLGDTGRAYDKDFWAKAVLKELNYYDIVSKNNVSFLICDDWRFINEFEYISSRYNTYTIKIESPNLNTDKYMYEHFSEKGLSNFYVYDFCCE